MLKLSDNPPMLSPQIDSLEQCSTPWWIAHTKSRNEKAFASDLLHLQIPYYLPMIPQVRFSGGRKRKVLQPLFSGYVFFCGTNEQRYQAMRTNRLCQTLNIPNQHVFIRELTNLHAGMQADKEISLWSGLARGQRCRISSGPCKGLEGHIIQKRSATILVLQVSILGQGAAIEIDCDLVRPLD